MTNETTDASRTAEALPGTRAALRWIEQLPLDGVEWRSFPKLGIRGGVGGFTPTVTRDTAGRCAWDIRGTSGACLSPMAVHVYNDAGRDLDDAVEADIDPWNAVHRIMRLNDDREDGTAADAAVWEIVVDIANHVRRRTTASRLASDGAARDPRRVAETHTTLARALLARTKPKTATVINDTNRPGRESRPGRDCNRRPPA